MECFFNDCNSLVVPNSTKCFFHRHRALCLSSDCRNQVYARRLCVKHGGKRPCQTPGCTANSRVGDQCSRHAASGVKKTCSSRGCRRMPRTFGLCVTHGGGKKCMIEGCTAHARVQSYCSRHYRLYGEAIKINIDSIEPFDFFELEQDTKLDDNCVEGLRIFGIMEEL